MRFRRYIVLSASLALCMTGAPPGGAAPAQPAAQDDIPVNHPSVVHTKAIAEQQRAATLGQEWRKSTDRAVVSRGDASGFHLLGAEARNGYRWRTIASLSEPGFEADAWIGNVCVTASGRRAVAVYAPRTFTNRADLADRGGFVAVVDLTSGQITKVRLQTSLAYFNPGCGTGETAVLTQGRGEDLDSTRIVELDTANGQLGKPIVVPGDLTSAVPTAHGIVAADSGALVRVDNTGRRTVIAGARGVPFRLAADADGGVVFIQREKADQASVNRAVITGTGRSAVATLATGNLTDLTVVSGRGGQVHVLGKKAARTGTAPRSVSLIDVPPGSVVSHSGEIAVLSVTRARLEPKMPHTDPLSPRPLTITAKSLRTGKEFALGAVADGLGGEGAMASPALANIGNAKARMSGGPNDPADGDQRTCSVARNDTSNQAMQPKPRQVEWAVDQAVRDVLKIPRPANWKSLGMPAYTPQGLFPPHGLIGQGAVPAQVLLGITAQESNMWQAARYAVPGVTANPLIGNYFGIDYYNGDEGDDWTIDWAEADCGYGITQVTDRMRLPGHGQPTMPYDEQRAVALDFAANVAKGLQILQDKWNQTRSAGLIVNNGDAARIENWFFAVWAYNSGFYSQSQAGANNGAWGVGWLNNPVNPRYPANRLPFLEYTYEDAAHPQDWPYPEKVLGWAGHPIEAIETPGNLVAGYRAAWWLTATDRARVKPPVDQFCDETNNCEPGAEHVPNDPDVIGEPAGPCAHRSSAGKYDLKCWYHARNTWKPDCSTTCGNEVLRFDPGYEYQQDANSYPPVCWHDLPGNTLVVDNVPQSVPSVRPGCTKAPGSGTFAFTFRLANNGSGTYPGKIDVHQLGASYNAHFWMSNTHKDQEREAVGTWRLDRAHTGPMKIKAFLPDPGARTNAAVYRVNAAGGGRSQIVRQAGTANRWVDIGTYMFNGVVPEVSLSNLLPANRPNENDGSTRIAWDALAFIPINGTYHEDVVESVAVFDEDQDIDTAAPGSWLAGPLASRQDLYDWAKETTGSILAEQRCGPGVAGACLGASTRQSIDRWRADVLAAGTDPVNHPDGKSLPYWIRFAQPYTDRPTSDQRPAHFDDPDRYKIRQKATVSYVEANGRIVAGSEFAAYEHHTGNTHIPPFVLEFIRSAEIDYGITKPNLWYRMRDLNVHDGASTSVDPMRNGILPGRAYSDGGIAPELVDGSGRPSDSPTCIRALTTGGGSIGYRPMLSQSGPTGAMDDWVYRMGHDNIIIPRSVYELAVTIRDTFFDAGWGPPISSIFEEAPPIWQELYFLACADGTVRQVTAHHPILRASYMPDQYLYRNGRSIDQFGVHRPASTSLERGNFFSFSTVPPQPDTPYAKCDTASTVSQSGNPWDIAIDLDNAGVNPDFQLFCNGAATPDESHSNLRGAESD